VPSLRVGGLGKVAVRDRVLVHEGSRAEELAELKRAQSVDHAGFEVKEHRAGYVLAAQGLVIKHDDAAEQRVVVAAVLADAVLAALTSQNPMPIWMFAVSREEAAWRLEARGKKRAGKSGET